MSRLLLLEDDLSLIDGLKYSLEKNGFELDVVRSVRAARERLRERHGYDLLLLDVTLPDGTGFMICDEVRASGDMTPIIFLTAADEETSIIRGLTAAGTTISQSLSNLENCAPGSGRSFGGVHCRTPLMRGEYAPARLRSTRQRQKHIWTENIWILPARNTAY